jgi:hypothetical protein
MLTNVGTATSSGGVLYARGSYSEGGSYMPDERLRKSRCTGW